MTINLKINLKILFTVLAAAFIVVFAFRAPSTKAQASSLSGSCGIIMNANFGGWLAGAYGDSVGQNSLGVFNFDKGTFEAVTNYVNGYQTANPSETQATNSGAFTISAGPIQGTYALKGAGSQINATLYILPVNGGNTFLVTDATSTKPSSAGVCQKI